MKEFTSPPPPPNTYSVGCLLFPITTPCVAHHSDNGLLSKEYIVFFNALKAARKHPESLSQMADFQQSPVNTEKLRKSFYTRQNRPLGLFIYTAPVSVRTT
jgi:hypothetical protein